MTVSLTGARFGGQPGWLARRRAARAALAAAEVWEADEWMAALEAADPDPAPDPASTAAEESARAEIRRMHLKHVGDEWLTKALEASRRNEVPFIDPNPGRVL